ncbi:MAG TPA: kelch repeat-containing protein, partial [Bryobacteraceae bacterium]|nr:kelch repeat-containing protein [Bryobacteraceae bacterium]
MHLWLVRLIVKGIIDMAASSDRSTSCTHFSNLVTSRANPNARPRWRSAVPGAFALLLAGAISIPPVTAYAQGTFVPTGSMNTARQGAIATLLQNGQVLVAGGGNSFGALTSAELYDPNTQSFSVTGSMSAARGTPTATLLPNGQVLITGGSGSSGLPLASAELYNPATGTFTLTGSMNTPREDHTATLLQNGQVLIAGGSTGGPTGVLASAELYNPATGTFSYTGSMRSARFSPGTALLTNGQVLVAGGATGGPTGYLASAELYNPVTWTFSYTGSLSTARAYYTSALLQSGQVLEAGGDSNSVPTTTAELYNPTTGTFSPTGSMAYPQGVPTLLADGQVLFAGGSLEVNNPIAAAELYNPTTGIFSLTGSLITARNGAAATLLQNGQVLVTGGFNGSGALASAELYLPAGVMPLNGTTVDIKGSGTVQDNQGPAIDCTSANGAESGTCATTYSGAGTVTLTATPAAGFSSVAWTTTGYPTCVPSGNTCSFPISPGYTNFITAGFSGPATTLVFAGALPNTLQGSAMAPAVLIEDSYGNLVAAGPASTALISIAIGTNPAGGTLSGVTTVNAVNGVATFSGLTIDQPGNGYTLVASSTGLTPATSASFGINSLAAGPVNYVTLGAQSGTLDSGTAGSATYLVTVDYTIPQSYGGGGKGTAYLSLNTSLPAGASASFNPPSLYFCCSPGDESQLQSTLTISTSAGTPAGETHFIAVATSEHGGGSIADGTLAIDAGETITGGGSIANVCPNGQTTPAPCSAPITVQFSGLQGTNLGANSVQVVTQGAPNLDFTLANTTCTGSPTSCTVNVTFAPRAPGLRLGGVNLSDASGNPLGSSLIYGIGNGPAVAFAPGVQTTVGSGLNYPYDIAVDSAGDVFIADLYNIQVVEFTPGGAAITVPASGLGGPTGVAVDGAGDVFIADPSNSQVLEVTPSGVQTIALNSCYPTGVAVDGAGDVFIADPCAMQVVKITPSGVATPVPATGLIYPWGVAVDAAGDVFIADPKGQQVVKVTPGGVQTTVPATGLSYPQGVAVDAAGDVFIADQFGYQVVEVTAAGVQTTVQATGLAGPTGVAVDGAGDVFIADPNSSQVVELQRSQAPSLTFASTNLGSTSADSPQSITAQNIGNQPLNAVAPGLVVTGPNFVQVPGSGIPPDCTGSFALAPGASCNLSLSFHPQSDGPLTSTAVFTDNALNTSPSAMQSIALAGVGTGVAVPNVVGQAQAAATSAITSAGLVLGTVTSAPSTTVPIG